MVGLSCFVMVSYKVLSVWPCFCLTQSRLNWFPQKPSESFASCGIASFASGFDSEKSCNQRELGTCESEGALQMFPGPLKQALELWCLVMAFGATTNLKDFNTTYLVRSHLPAARSCAKKWMWIWLTLAMSESILSCMLCRKTRIDHTAIYSIQKRYMHQTGYRVGYVNMHLRRHVPTFHIRIIPQLKIHMPHVDPQRKQSNQAQHRVAAESQRDLERRLERQAWTSTWSLSLAMARCFEVPQSWRIFLRARWNWNWSPKHPRPVGSCSHLWRVWKRWRLGIWPWPLARTLAGGFRRIGHGLGLGVVAVTKRS